jgi:hypothetical protein
VTQILLGWSGSQEGVELALQPLVIEVEELVAPRSTGLLGVQLQLLEGLDDCVNAGGIRRLDGGESRANSPSMVTMKSRFSKRMCATRTQLMLWLAIRGLLKMTRRTKGPYLAR